MAKAWFATRDLVGFIQATYVGFEGLLRECYRPICNMEQSLMLPSYPLHEASG